MYGALRRPLGWIPAFLLVWSTSQAGQDVLAPVERKIAAGQLKEAEDLLGSLILREPGNSEAQGLLAQVHVMAGRPGHATRVLTTYLQEHPSDHSRRLDLARIYYRQGLFKSCAGETAILKRTAAGRTEYLEVLGDLALVNRDTTGALTAYKAALLGDSGARTGRIIEKLSLINAHPQIGTLHSLIFPILDREPLLGSRALSLPQDLPFSGSVPGIPIQFRMLMRFAPEGTVTDVLLLSLSNDAADSAMMRWARGFLLNPPGLRRGVPVPFWMLMTIEIEMDKSEHPHMLRPG
jgi:hypothetical protein